MIQSILQKCLDNLNATTPDLSYIRGMLEVVIAMQDKPMESSSKAEQASYTRPVTGSNPVVPTDDASILDAQARASLETIKALASKSTDYV